MGKTWLVWYAVPLAVAVAFSMQTRQPTVAKGQRAHTLPLGEFIPEEMVVCAEEDAVVFSAVHNRRFDQRAVYLFQFRTGELKEIVRAQDVNMTALPTPHFFAVVATNLGRSQLVVLHDARGVARAVDPPLDKWRGGPVSTPDGRLIAFLGDRPGRTKQYDEDSDAVGMVDLNTFQMRWFPLKDPGCQLSVPAFDGLFHVSHCIDKGPGRGATVYDLNGSVVSRRPDLRGVYFSATGRYYLPWSEHWELGAIYSAKTNKPLRTFRAGPCDDCYFHACWNPRNDDLLGLWRGTTGGRESFQIYSVSRGKPVRSFPDVLFGDTPVAWSADGNSLVRLQAGKITFEPIIP